MPFLFFIQDQRTVEKIIIATEPDDAFFLNTLPSYHHVTELIIHDYLSSKWLNNIADWIEKNPSVYKVVLSSKINFSEKWYDFIERLLLIPRNLSPSKDIGLAYSYSIADSSVQVIFGNYFIHNNLSKIRFNQKIKEISVQSSVAGIPSLIDSLANIPKLERLHITLNEKLPPSTTSLGIHLSPFEKIFKLKNLTSISIQGPQFGTAFPISYHQLIPFIRLKKLSHIAIRNIAIFEVDVLEFLGQHQGIETMEMYATRYLGWSQDSQVRMMNGIQTHKREFVISDTISIKVLKFDSFQFQPPFHALFKEVFFDTPERFPNLESLLIRNEEVPKELENWTQLKALFISGKVQANLSKLTQLRHLSLSINLNKDANIFQAISNLKTLESLNLNIGVPFTMSQEIEFEATWPNIQHLSIGISGRQPYPLPEPLQTSGQPAILKFYLNNVEEIEIKQLNHTEDSELPLTCNIQADHINKFSITNPYIKEVVISTPKLDSLFIPIDILSRLNCEKNKSIYTANYLNISPPAQPYKTLIVDQVAVIAKAFPFKHLTSLEWTGDFEKIPNNVLACDSLRFLQITSLNLRELPQNIGRLSQLKTLMVFSRGVRKLPLSLAHCTELTSIICYGASSFSHIKTKSKFKKIPKFLYEMESLKALDVKYNQLQKVSPKVLNAPRLVWLDLRQNKVKRLSPKLYQDQRLKVLY